MTLDRRTFLASLAALTLVPGRATATSHHPKHLVLLFASGGWDPTVVFDPKPDSSVVDMEVGEPYAFGNGSLWTHASRPSVTDFFGRYGSLCTVINGVNVPAIAHAGCRTRMLTGTRDRAQPDVGAVVAHALGAEVAMPYLDISGGAYPGPYASELGYMGASNQLSRLVLPDRAFRPPHGSLWDRHFPNENQSDAIRDWVQSRADGAMVERAAEGENARRKASFINGLERGHRLFEYETFFENTAEDSSLSEQVRTSLDALAMGLSKVVMIDARADFDTHRNNQDQSKRYEATFSGLLELMEGLSETPGAEGGVLLDDTLVFVLSEMGRTPRHNDDRGKDHWPYTSCLLLGAGVRGNTIVGSTNTSLVGQPVDLNTGHASASGTLLQSEHVLAGIADLFGVKPEGALGTAAPFRGFHA